MANQPFERSSSGSSITPRVAARRVQRYHSRGFTSPHLTARVVERPPIVVDWSSSAVLRLGYAEEWKPQHILVLPENSKKCQTESQWYDVVSPIVRKMFDQLMVDPTLRRIVCVTRPYAIAAWEEALEASFWTLGVPAVCFVHSIEVIPLALKWNHGLVVQVGLTESHCQGHANGHPLSFTYQAVPCGYEDVVEDGSKIQCQWNATMQKLWLDEHHPHSLIVAVLKCLELCPRDVRKDIVRNIVFCGDALIAVPDLGRRLGLHMKKILSGDEAAELVNKDRELPALTTVPVNLSQLKPLADEIGLISCAPYRADFLAWAGASVYSTIWHRYDEHDKNMKWKFAPTEDEES